MMGKPRGNFGNQVGTAMNTKGGIANTRDSRRRWTYNFHKREAKRAGYDKACELYAANDPTKVPVPMGIFCTTCGVELDPEFELARPDRMRKRRCADCKASGPFSGDVRFCRMCGDACTRQEWEAFPDRKGHFHFWTTHTECKAEYDRLADETEARVRKEVKARAAEAGAEATDAYREKLAEHRARNRADSEPSPMTTQERLAALDRRLGRS